MSSDMEQQLKRCLEALEWIIELAGSLPQPTLEEAMFVIVEIRLEANKALGRVPDDQPVEPFRIDPDFFEKIAEFVEKHPDWKEHLKK